MQTLFDCYVFSNLSFILYGHVSFICMDMYLAEIWTYLLFVWTCIFYLYGHVSFICMDMYLDQIWTIFYLYGHVCFICMDV